MTTNFPFCYIFSQGEVVGELYADKSLAIGARDLIFLTTDHLFICNR